MPKEKTIPLTKLLIKLMAASGQTAIDYYNLIYDLKYHRQDYLAGGHKLVKEMERLRELRQAEAALYQLRRSKYIKAKKIGDKMIVHLTAKGLTLTLADSLRRSPKKSTGYTVVIFDIPENVRLARDHWRWLLKQGGFTKLQQSVWCSQRDVYDLITKFAKKYRLEKWVNVFQATDFWQRPNRHSFK